MNNDDAAQILETIITSQGKLIGNLIRRGFVQPTVALEAVDNFINTNLISEEIPNPTLEGFDNNLEVGMTIMRPGPKVTTTFLDTLPNDPMRVAYILDNRVDGNTVVAKDAIEIVTGVTDTISTQRVREILRRNNFGLFKVSTKRGVYELSWKVEGVSLTDFANNNVTL